MGCPPDFVSSESHKVRPSENLCIKVWIFQTWFHACFRDKDLVKKALPL